MFNKGEKVGANVRRRVALGAYQGHNFMLKLHESRIHLTRDGTRPVEFDVDLKVLPPNRAVVITSDKRCLDALYGVAGAKPHPEGCSLLLSSREYTGLVRLVS